MELRITNPFLPNTTEEAQAALLRGLGLSLEDIERALDRRRRRVIAASQVTAHVEKGGRVL